MFKDYLSGVKQKITCVFLCEKKVLLVLVYKKRDVPLKGLPFSQRYYRTINSITPNVPYRFEYLQATALLFFSWYIK